MLLVFSLQLLQNQREMEEMKKSWQERLAEQEAANKVGNVYPFHHELACVASVSVRFQSKERWTRVKSRAKNGASKRAGRRGQNRTSRPSVFLCSETKRKRLLRRLIISFHWSTSVVFICAESQMSNALFFLLQSIISMFTGAWQVTSRAKKQCQL